MEKKVNIPDRQVLWNTSDAEKIGAYIMDKA